MSSQKDPLQRTSWDQKSGKAKRDYRNTEENLERNGYFKKLK